MEHGTNLTGIAFVVVCATLCGIALVRMRQPAIIGFILAGVLLGPSGLGLVENRDNVAILAELGVILLLYFIGLELSLRSFRVIWKLVVGAAFAQITLSVGAAWGLTSLVGWPPSYAIFFGFCLAMSSTAVAISILEEVDQLRTKVGKVTIGILIAQDLAVAPMLLIVSNLGGGEISPWIAVEVLVSVGLLVALILYLTRRKRIDMPFHNLIVGRTDLGPLAALAICFGMAAMAGLVGLSPAFGAFLGGLIAGSSNQRKVIRADAEPVQAVLMMVFFLSIGLLLDLDFMIEHWAVVLAGVLVVTVFKTMLNLTLLRLQGLEFSDAFKVSLTIGQIGEFAFVLAAAALSARVIEPEVHKLVVAITVLSLVISPIYVDALQRAQGRAASRAPGLGKMLKLIYFREWRLTRRISRAAWAAIYSLASGIADRADNWRAKAKAKQQETATLPKADAAPASPTGKEDAP